MVAALAVFARDAAETPDIDRRAEAFDNYLQEHPYLKVPVALTRFYRPAFLERLEEVRNEREGRGTLPPPAVIEQEQARLDGLADEFLAQERRSVWNRLGYVPAAPRPTALFTSLFVHGDMLHLLGNLLFFYLCAPFVEDAFGRPFFAILYLASGVAAALAHATRFPESLSPLIGASGAIAGIMGAFLVRYFTARVSFLFMPFLFLPTVRFVIKLPAFVFLPAWFLEQFWLASTSGPRSGVAFWAHVGGFVFGLGVALVVRLTGVEERYIHPGIEGKISIVQHPALEVAADARHRGDFVTARRELRKVLAAEPANPDAWSEAYELAMAADDAVEIERSVSRLADLHQKAGEVGLAVRLYEDFVERSAERPASPRVLLAAGQAFERNGDGRRALEVYERIVAERPDDAAAFRALYRSGEVLRKGGDSKGARAAYEHARAHPACVDPWPTTLDRALASLSGGGVSPRS